MKFLANATDIDRVIIRTMTGDVIFIGCQICTPINARVLRGQVVLLLDQNGHTCPYTDKRTFIT